MLHVLQVHCRVPKGNGLQPSTCLIYVRTFHDVFEDPSDSMPPHKQVDDEVHLEPGASPPNRGVYRMSVSELQELKEQLADLLQKGFVRPSTSPFRPRVLLYGQKIVFSDCVWIVEL